MCLAKFEITCACKQGATPVPYSAEISRAQPTAVLFIVDQSSSMNDLMQSGKTKAQHVADALNRTLQNLIIRCTRAGGVRDYFDVGVLGYGGSGVTNGFTGALGVGTLHPLSSIYASPLRIDERKLREDDGAGGIVERSLKFPVWFEAKAAGGTPMTAALNRAKEELHAWCDSHPGNYPPTILHFTDGEATDGDPSIAAQEIRDFLFTSDGAALLYNLHVSTGNGDAEIFPADSTSLADRFAQQLFEMSSLLTDGQVELARRRYSQIGSGARGFIYNADAVHVIDFFDIGTRPATSPQ